MSVTLQTVYDETRRLIRASTVSTGATDSELLNLSNQTYFDIQRELASRDVVVFGVRAYASLVENQETYSFPDDCLLISRIELNYDDPTDNTKWQKMTFNDIPNIPEEWFRFVQRSQQSQPVAALFGSAYYIAPTASTSKVAGIKIWYVPKQSDFIGASSVIPYPLDMRWEAIAEGNAYRYFLPFNDEQVATHKALYNEWVNKIVTDLRYETNEPVKSQSVDYTNYGYF